MRLVVHAVQALHDRLLELVDDLGALAGLGIDLVDALVMDLYLEVLGPAAVAAQPAARTGLGRPGLHGLILCRGSRSGLAAPSACTRSPAATAARLRDVGRRLSASENPG